MTDSSCMFHIHTIQDVSVGSFDFKGTNGYILNGINVEHAAGFSVSSGGDVVNGDGIDEIFIGARLANRFIRR